MAARCVPAIEVSARYDPHQQPCCGLHFQISLDAATSSICAAARCISCAGQQDALADASCVPAVIGLCVMCLFAFRGGANAIGTLSLPVALFVIPLAFVGMGLVQASLAALTRFYVFGKIPAGEPLRMWSK